jgi:hypothetical protein
MGRLDASTGSQTASSSPPTTLHEPWVFLSPPADAVVLAYPTKRYRSAWIGIAVHSAQSAVIVIVVLTLVV